MKISCPTCAAKYSVADEKIQARLAKIRCRKCSSTIVIDGTSTPASVYIGEGSSPVSSSAAPQPEPTGADAGAAGGLGFSVPAASDPVGPAPDEYAVDIADNDQRNMTIHQIVGAYNEGLITGDTYIWKEGMADWQTLGEVPEVAAALHAAARPAAPIPAAVRRPAPAADLFGSIHTAGGESDITTSAPEPAPMVMTAGTGARNESSVLFSLSALTASESSSSSPPNKRARASSDDSGLIDLQALTAADANGAGAFAAPVGGFGASPLISAPLGGVSGPAIGMGLAPGYERRGGGRSLVIAAALLVAGILAAAFVVVRRGGMDEAEPTSALDRAAATAEPGAQKPMEPEDPKPSAAAAAAEPETESATAAKNDEAVSADELPAATEQAAASKPAAPPRRAVAKAPRPAPRAKPQAAAPAPEPAPAPKPAATAASDEDAPKKKKAPAGPRCDCKPADLMCAMRCSAKK